ncbi:hypothetical protein X777_02780 [Ooceraea biroi]|uniref:Uncharacterized protein n=1 Tax=Ooceraea biroi TaxID=2015173 RepID=A0A026WPA6_OOCBI|nr:hypothetical protein X777_02780 [Ooceraea biroi]
MPGGEGSPINLLDHHHHQQHRRSSTATAAAAATSTSTTDECANGDDVRTAASTTTGATFSSTMASALAGDGLRRRKVIHAAKETLDKGESEHPFPQRSFCAVPSCSEPPLRNLAQPLVDAGTKSDRVPYRPWG